MMDWNYIILSRIKKILNSISSTQKMLSSTQKLIGTTTDIGGDSTKGTVFAKENAILEKLKNGGIPVVKSVQRGKISSSTFPISVYISTINPEKAFVIVDTNSNSSGYQNRVSLFELKSSEIKFSIGNNSYSTYSTTFSWQIVELN